MSLEKNVSTNKIDETYELASIKQSSVHGLEQTIDICEKDFKGLCFVNLVDFDALWGHRRNVTGYGEEIEKFDKNLGILMEKLRDDGFDFLDMTLPGEIVYKSFGFSEDEILKLKRYAKNNSSLIWDFAQKGGGENA